MNIKTILFPNRILSYLKLRKRIMNSGYFDQDFYLATNEDVRKSRQDPLHHFIHYGAREGRSPASNFDIQAYYSDNPDVLRSGENPVSDWLRFGPVGMRKHPKAVFPGYTQATKIGSESDLNNDSVYSREFSGRKLYDAIKESELFDREYYISAYNDVKNSNIDPIIHYIKYGYKENRNPSYKFDTYYYSIENGYRYSPNDPAGALESFILEGRKAGLKCRPEHSVDLNPIMSHNLKSKIAIHAHLFYPEYVEKFAFLLSSLDIEFELFVSTCSDVDAEFIRRNLARILIGKSVCVRAVPNRGRDIAPFLLSFPEIWRDFDYVLHLHSKKSPHAGFGEEWSEWILRNLLGDPGIALAALRHLEDNADLAMLFPDNFWGVKRYASWAGNEERIRALLARLTIPKAKFPNFSHFAAGSMAWFRTSAFRHVADQLNLDDFEIEEGQVEGTLAHVLERALPLYAQQSGYKVSTYYLRNIPELPEFDRVHGRVPSSEIVGERWMRDTPRIAAETPEQLNPLSALYNPNVLDISWIVPDFALGAGGHMTIFRIVELLEIFGHRQTIWIQNARNYPDPETARSAIQKHYRKIGDRVSVRFLPDDVRQLSGDALIATDCWTVFPAKATTNFKQIFYFIQDYEPFFHALGENYLIAESTYRMDLAGLCAGDWLLNKAVEHGMWARKWDLASDPDFYFPAAKVAPSTKARKATTIAFYNRGYTPRRAVNLGLSAFEELAKRRRDFEVLMFGQPPKDERHGFDFKELGVCAPEKLGELYRSADIGVAFSATNYSLIPLEMMACGLPVVELDVDSTRAAYPPDTAILAQPSPSRIADAIEVMMDDSATRSRQVAAASDFVKELDWRKSARAIEAAIRERLEEVGAKAIDPYVLARPALIRKLKASVVIPTYNGGELFRKVLDQVCAQKCDFSFDILVIDSSSSDGTAQYVADKGRSARVHVIDKAEFQHGRTRNIGISMTDGEIAVLLTQDAMPEDQNWLAALVGGFDLGPRIACAIGRHRAYENHNPLVARDLDRMFDRFADLGPIFELDRGLPSFIPRGCLDWRMIMHFYSDNNSAMRRSVWQELPYPEIDWGEDQVWAWEALKLGFAKVYVDGAVVRHSHDFALAKQVEVATAEGRMFAEFFGYNLQLGGVCQAQIDEIERRERLYTTRAGISEGALMSYVKALKASMEGRGLGAALAARNR